MPNIQVKLRRGTEAEHDTTSGGFIGAEGEVTVDTTNDTIRVHDGATAGGVRLAKHSELATAGTGGTVTSVDSGTGLTGGPITSSGTLSIDNGGVDTTQLADNAITPAKISSTDTLLNINDTHQTIGLGILANASSSSPTVSMDGGVRVGDVAPSVAGELEVTGNGAANILIVENTSTTATDQSVITCRGPSVTFQLKDTQAPSNQGTYNITVDSGFLQINLVSDDGQTTTGLMKLTSAGNLELRGTLSENQSI
jgi:hypothetical protein